jgi:hypothetical protein
MTTPVPADDDRQGCRTEWVTREYDADGLLVSEVVTTKVTYTPKADAQPEPGGYL